MTTSQLHAPWVQSLATVVWSFAYSPHVHSFPPGSQFSYEICGLAAVNCPEVGVIHCNLGKDQALTEDE